MEQENYLSNNKTPLAILWIISLITVSIISYLIGVNGNKNQISTQIVPSITLVPTVVVNTVPLTVIPTIDLNSICEITGPSQKKDYLVSYVIKEGDSLNRIAEEQLGSSTRNTEILKLNDSIQQLTLGSIIYLPPKFINQSSGNIGEVSGRLVKKDIVSWQLSYGGGVDGMGIVFPGYWFKDLKETSSYKLGDCVTILFDNGVKVYSIEKNN